MSESEFGSAGIYRILKKAGAERVGDDAVLELKASLEEIGMKISTKAVSWQCMLGERL
jgi:histone H3/H4